jgi:hypothetical protein
LYELPDDDPYEDPYDPSEVCDEDPNKDPKEGRYYGFYGSGSDKAYIKLAKNWIPFSIIYCSFFLYINSYAFFFYSRNFLAFS